MKGWPGLGFSLLAEGGHVDLPCLCQLAWALFLPHRGVPYGLLWEVGRGKQRDSPISSYAVEESVTPSISKLVSLIENADSVQPTAYAGPQSHPVRAGPLEDQ